MKLNTATNLPKLPEGQYWSVRGLPGHGAFNVAVIEDVMIPGEIIPGKHWWNDPVFSIPTIESHVVIALDVMDPAKEAAWKTDYAEYEERCREIGRHYPYYPSTAFAADHLTDELVLATAKKLMDTLKARQRRADLDAKDNTYLGTYPPNKLDGAK